MLLDKLLDYWNTWTPGSIEINVELALLFTLHKADTSCIPNAVPLGSPLRNTPVIPSFVAILLKILVVLLSFFFCCWVMLKNLINTSLRIFATFSNSWMSW